MPATPSNLLSPGDLLDEISGNSVLNGIPVTISAADKAHVAVTLATERATR